MEGAPGRGPIGPIVSAKFTSKLLSGFIGHPVYDATITITAHQSTSQPPAGGERTN